MVSSVMDFAPSYTRSELTRFERRQFEGLLADAIADARGEELALSVLFLDLDYFKCISDTYGSDRAYLVLGAVKRLLEDTAGEDYVYHCGAQEFLVVLQGTDGQRAERAAEQLRRRIGRHRFFRDVDCSVTVSIGIAELGRSLEPQALIQAADEALYVAKKLGRNRVIRAQAPEPGWSTGDYGSASTPSRPSSVQSAFDIRWGARLQRCRRRLSVNDTDHGEPLEFLG